MSSGTSTKEVRLKPDATSDDRSHDRSVRLQPDRHDGLQPWQFFVLAGLGCATAVAYLAAGRGVRSIVLLTALMATAALVGMAALRTLRPLLAADEDRAATIGHRTRIALEREKMLTLRSIKELEFDRAMGKLSEGDWQEMSTRLRARAASLIRRLDAGSDYRAQIEAEVAKRIGIPTDTARHVCAKCSTTNDTDARFCKSCGQEL